MLSYMKLLLSLLFLLSFRAQASIYASYYLWPKHEIKTCFAKGDDLSRNDGKYVLRFRNWNKSQKEQIKRWVQEEYSSERTGIHFVGFEDCGVNPDIDVAIFYNQNSKMQSILHGGLDGLASLGTMGAHILMYPLIKGFVIISKTGFDKGTVVHEFGHVAALEHEHEHPDAVRFEPECSYTNEYPIIKAGYIYEPFDKDSVMNYCKVYGSKGKKAGLSIRDVEVLRRIYP